MIGEIALGLFGLGIMVFIHEMGHLVAAKLLGIKVETFSLGYGKKLVGFKWGETTYQIAVFPIGGFCKMKGEHLFARAVEENLDRIPDDEEHYYNSPPWKRIIVSLAGAGANILFAFIFLTILYIVGFQEHSYSNRIILASDFSFISGVPADAPANQAGLQTGDRIVNVNGRLVQHWGDVIRTISDYPKETIPIEVDRGGRQLSLSITPDLDTERIKGTIGIYTWMEPVIASVGEAMKQKNPWLMPGDRIVSLNGTPVRHQLDISSLLQNKPESVTAVIDRSGVTLTQRMIIPYKTIKNDKNEEETVPNLDIPFLTGVYHTPQYSVFGAAGKSVSEIYLTIRKIVQLVALIPYKINVRNALGGPVAATVIIGVSTAESFERGFDQAVVNFVLLISLISTILAFMNLLPLPMLDGGFVVLFSIEWIRKRPWRPRFLMNIQLIGIALFGVLFVFILLNDISFLVNFFN